jgi:hypothetical protein
MVASSLPWRNTARGCHVHSLTRCNITPSNPRSGTITSVHRSRRNQTRLPFARDASSSCAYDNHTSGCALCTCNRREPPTRNSNREALTRLWPLQSSATGELSARASSSTPVQSHHTSRSPSASWFYISSAHTSDNHYHTTQQSA